MPPAPTVAAPACLTGRATLRPAAASLHWSSRPRRTADLNRGQFAPRGERASTMSKESDAGGVYIPPASDTLETNEPIRVRAGPAKEKGRPNPDNPGGPPGRRRVSYGHGHSRTSRVMAVALDGDWSPTGLGEGDGRKTRTGERGRRVGWPCWAVTSNVCTHFIGLKCLSELRS
jgi:hypothetical protein